MRRPLCPSRFFTGSRARRVLFVSLSASSLWLSASRIHAQAPASARATGIPPRPRPAPITSPTGPAPSAADPPPSARRGRPDTPLIGVLYAVVRVNGQRLPVALTPRDTLYAGHLLFESPTTFSRGAVGTGPAIRRAARLLRMPHPEDKEGRTLLGLTGVVAGTGGGHRPRLVFDVGRRGYRIEAPAGLRWQSDLRLRVTVDGHQYEVILHRVERPVGRRHH